MGDRRASAISGRRLADLSGKVAPRMQGKQGEERQLPSRLAVTPTEIPLEDAKAGMLDKLRGVFQQKSFAKGRKSCR